MVVNLPVFRFSLVGRPLGVARQSLEFHIKLSILFPAVFTFGQYHQPLLWALKSPSMSSISLFNVEVSIPFRKLSSTAAEPEWLYMLTMFSFNWLSKKILQPTASNFSMCSSLNLIVISVKCSPLLMHIKTPLFGSPTYHILDSCNFWILVVNYERA